MIIKNNNNNKNKKKIKTSHGYPKPRAASVDKDGHFPNSFPNEEQGVNQHFIV